MSSCAIILNSGQYPKRLREILDGVDCIIATDGAEAYCHKKGIAVDVVIGDMDSVTPLAGSKEVRRVYIADQNSTDCQKAIRYAQQQNISRVYLVGILGDRYDHSFSHLQMMLHYQKMFTCLVGFTSTEYGAFFFNDSVIQGIPDQRVAFISFSGAVELVTEGLHWPISRLDEVTSSTANLFQDTSASIQLLTPHAKILMLAEIVPSIQLADIHAFLPLPQ